MRNKYFTGKRSLAVAAAAGLAVGAMSSSAQANPYASGIVENAGVVSYTLNENATDVTIYRDGVATSLGALSAGAQSFNLNGASQYHIQVTRTGAPSSYSLITTDSAANDFELPRGVGVNTNPSLNGAPNPYFGRVYVSNGRESATAAGRSMVSGIYGLNADLTSVFNDRTGGVAWLPAATDSSGVSPFRVQVGPDNQVYVTDWSDAHSGLWALDPEGNNGVEVLDSTGRDANGLNGVHGSISDVVIRGTGAARTIYTSDEDFNGGGEGVYRYDIGAANGYNAAPSPVFTDPNGQIINALDSLDMGSDGTFWFSQNRFGNPGETVPNVIQFNALGEVLWTSLQISPNGGTDQDPLRGTQGLAFDPVNEVLALATNRAGLIVLLDTNTKTVLEEITFGGGAANVDVVFDAAGNLYVTNRSAERLRVWSPGGDSVFTSDSLGGFYAGNAVIPEPTSLAMLALGGLFVGRRRRA